MNDLEWDVKTKRSIKWVADLGSHSYGNPVVASGMVFVGTTMLGMGAPAFALFNVGLAAFWLAVAFAIGKEYRHLAAKNLTNAAPLLTRPIPPAQVTPGRRFEHHLPHDLFVDHDPGDVLKLSARGQNGNALPAWLNFDAHGRISSWNAATTSTISKPPPCSNSARARPGSKGRHFRTFEVRREADI